MRKFVLGAAALAVAAAAVPASAQYSPVAAAIGNTIGNMAAAAAEHRCMSGNALPPGEVAEARVGGEAAMRDYLRLAGAAAEADVSAVFGRKPKHQTWTAGGRSKPVRSVDDPFARRVAAGEAVAAPAALVRSGDGGSALGTWILRPVGGGEPLGHYDAAFRREAGIWKLARLTLVQGAAASPAPAQYCHKPGDVEPYVAAIAEREAARQRKKAEKAARKAEREAARSEKAGS